MLDMSNRPCLFCELTEQQNMILNYRTAEFWIKKYWALKSNAKCFFTFPGKPGSRWNVHDYKRYKGFDKWWVKQTQNCTWCCTRTKYTCFEKQSIAPCHKVTCRWEPECQAEWAAITQGWQDLKKDLKRGDFELQIVLTLIQNYKTPEFWIGKEASTMTKTYTCKQFQQCTSLFINFLRLVLLQSFERPHKETFNPEQLLVYKACCMKSWVADKLQIKTEGRSRPGETPI